MKNNQSLKHTELCHKTNAKSLKFKSTAELSALKGILGQERALAAIEFGISIDHLGYNIFAIGPSGIGKHTLLNKVLQNRRSGKKKIVDWCYVYNFKKPDEPIALQLPAGKGKKFRKDMSALIDELRIALPALFDSDEYRGKLQEIESAYQIKHQSHLQELQKKAATHGLTVLTTPQGYIVAPLKKDQAMSQEEFDQLPEKERREKQKAINVIQQELLNVLRVIPRLVKERRQQEKLLEREATLSVVGQALEELLEKYQSNEKIIAYLRAVCFDIVARVKDFLSIEKDAPPAFGVVIDEEAKFKRYEVNVLIDHEGGVSSPVVYEDNPNHANLVGRIEQVAQFGALYSDFTLIRSGALHRANGGYLLLDAEKLLMEPYAWRTLKRLLYAKQIIIDSLPQALGWMTSITIKPKPIPLDVKVILIGPRDIYYALCEYDSDVTELFKIVADFSQEVERNHYYQRQYAQLITTLVTKHQLIHFSNIAVARVIDYAVRLTGDAQKISIHMRQINDLLVEASHVAQKAEHSLVTKPDVEKAIELQIQRENRIEVKFHEAITRDIMLVKTEGAMVGQINGLTVLQLGEYAFSKPVRITATARQGDAGIIDIEREVELGGPLHSKGVLILSGFLAQHYLIDKHLILSARIVFEQSYMEIDGDSASVAELSALLSAIGKIPINQALAVTGSVDQYGNVQAIGGVNEKIEGFLKVCQQRGFTDKQGVIIPKANVQHLMLNDEVIAAVKAKKFNIYPVKHMDEVLTLLMNMPAGVRDKKGHFSAKSIHGIVEKRLADFIEKKDKEESKL